MKVLSFHQGIIQGGIWVGLGFAGQQGIAAIRMLILARLLTPEDFGLAGLVTLVLFAGLILTELGLESAIIQRPKLTSEFLDTAWTILLVRGVGLFLLIQALAPWISTMFDHQELESLLRVGAVSFLLVNLSVVSYAFLLRELRYRNRVILDVCREFSATVLGLCLAVWFHNAWALVGALLFGQLVTLIGAWFLHPYRPRLIFNREALSVFWGFGCHLYLSGLLTYVITRGADFAVGKFRGINELGQFQMMASITEILTRSLGGTVSQVMFPAYSHIAAEGKNLIGVFDEVWRALLCLLLPIASILAVFHVPIVDLVLGEQWVPAAMAFGILAGSQVFRALAASCGTLILAAGKTWYLSRIKLMETACFLLLIVPFTIQWGLEGAASCLLIGYGLSLVGHVYAAQQVSPILKQLLPCTVEATSVTLILATVFGQFTHGGTGSVLISMFLWMVMWMGYVALRQAKLVAKIWTAVYEIWSGHLLFKAAKV